MKKNIVLNSTFLCFLLFLSISLMAQLQTFEHNGMNRQYIYYAPDNLPPDAPLVVVMHGYTDNASSIQNYSGMNAIADNNDFAVCYPQGTTDNWGLTFFNVGYDFHTSESVDDLDFIVQLVAYLQAEHNLSTQNTFATGLSNGGDMCYLIACEAFGTFKAVAPVAGMMLKSIENNCNPSIPISLFEIHGTEDDVTYFDGDINNVDGWGAYSDIPYTINFWSEQNGCSDIQTDTLPDINANDGSFVVSEKCMNAANGHEVWLYKVVGGGHDWPGSWGNMDIVASEEIWHFFNRFLSDTTPTQNPKVPEQPIALFPIPAKDYIILKTSEKYTGNSFLILDSKGKEFQRGTISSALQQISLNTLSPGIYFLRVAGSHWPPVKFVKGE